MASKSTLAVLGLRHFTREHPEFYVNTISSHLKTSHLHINKPHKHDFFAAFLFTKGSGKHEIDFNSYEVKPGAVFLLSPGQTHNWQLSGDAEGIIFFHSQATNCFRSFHRSRRFHYRVSSIYSNNRPTVKTDHRLMVST